MKNIGLVVNTEKPKNQQVLDVCCETARVRRITLWPDRATAAWVGRGKGRSVKSLSETCDALIVLGGDGTILRVARELNGSQIPIFGVNLGNLGFLTAAPVSALGQALECLFDGNFKLSPRSLVDVKVTRKNKVVYKRIGLNEAVINRGEVSRNVKISVTINKEFLSVYSCDGMIFATPTGSTAYSLAAGGPLVSPESKVIVVTPICPHALSNRSVVVSDTSLIEASIVQQTQKVNLNIDGQDIFLLKTGDLVGVSIAKANIQLAKMPDYSYYGVLRQKLNWSGSNV